MGVADRSKLRSTAHAGWRRQAVVRMSAGGTRDARGRTGTWHRAPAERACDARAVATPAAPISGSGRPRLTRTAMGEPGFTHRPRPLDRNRPPPPRRRPGPTIAITRLICRCLPSLPGGTRSRLKAQQDVPTACRTPGSRNGTEHANSVRRERRVRLPSAGHTASNTASVSRSPCGRHHRRRRRAGIVVEAHPLLVLPVCAYCSPFTLHSA